MEQFLLRGIFVAAPVIIVIALFVVLLVIYLILRIFLSSDVASGFVMGLFWGLLIGLPIGLICVWIEAGSLATMFFGRCSWMPFVYGWGATTLISGIIGAIKEK